MKQKQIFKTILLYLAILLAVLPFLVTFNAVLTELVERFELYNWIQERIVPIQSQLVGLLVKPFGISYVPFRDGMLVNEIPMRMTWNCLGWQSLLLFGASLVIGLRDASYTMLSRFQVVILGLFGIFWVNLFRITFTVLLAAFVMPIFRIVFHDYLAAATTVLWLIFFWWFSYSFVLEEKYASQDAQTQLQNN